MSTRRLRRSATIALSLALLGVMSACTSSGGSNVPTPGTSTGGASRTADRSATTTAHAPSAVVSFAPRSGSVAVSPTGPISVAVANGTLNTVTMTGDGGAKVAGTLTADGTSWRAADPLGYGKKYTVTATALNADRVSTTQVSTFTTVQPVNLTMPYFRTTGGGQMEDGATYGVGFVVGVHFDEEIPDKAAAEKALVVKTTPAVTGSWYWLDDQNVHWRPQTYYKPGTKVTVTAKVYGLDVGGGLYGQADTSASFTVGASQISIADDNTKQVQVFQNGKLIRTMPTSMGRGGTQVVNGRTISYWTQRGTYTVLDKSNPVLMDSSTYGLPQDKGGYKEYINWATRISTDGVYLHELDTTVWAQGNTDTSHGCLNLNHDNAQWYFNFSQVGDVVQVKNTGGAPLEVWQNGDWSLPWAQWLAGSALH